MNAIFKLTWVLAFVMCFCLNANADNNLTIEQVVGKVGKTVNVPVDITNDDEVVAAQFDVTLPFRMASKETIRMTNRVVGHSVSTKNNGKTVTVVLSSMDNKPLRGNSGTVFYIPMSTSDEGKDAYDIMVSNIVLTDKYGNNIATEKSSTGEFIVSHENVPDFIAENVAVKSNIAPGEMVDISWNVKNIGDGNSLAGFGTKIYLESATTGVRTYVGTVSTETEIAAGGTLPVAETMVIPRAAHMDGKVKVYVEIVPNANSGELKVDRVNNFAYSPEVNLSKQLYLTCSSNTIREGQYSGYVTMTLTRSGDWSVAESYTVDASVSKLLCTGSGNYNILPTKIVIPAQSASASLRLYAVNDDIVRARTVDVTVAASHGYNGLTMTLLRTDDDKNPLSLNLSQTSITEGQQLTVTATRGGELTDAIDIPLHCSAAVRFAEMPVLHFAAGKTTASAVINSIDDKEAHMDCQVKFSITATDYMQAVAYLSLADNDRPNLSLEISPSVVSESAGNYATTATLRRDGDLSQSISAKITSDRSEVFTGNNIVQIPSGQSSVEIPVGVKDNASVDGLRRCELSAAMYIKADKVYAPEGNCAFAEASFDITDDESPYLALSARTTNIGEGSDLTVKLSRIVPKYTGDLVVTLKCNDKNVVIPTSVTIPSGSSVVDFVVHVNKNTTTDDDRFATIMAEAEGLMTATIKLRISDRTLPDATIIAVGHEGDLYSGCPAFFLAEVHNDGTDVLPKGTTIDFCLASSSELSYYTENKKFFSTSIEKDIEPGETMTFKWRTTVPEVVGKWWLNAIINPDGKVAEFSTTNNRSSKFEPVFINAPFSLVEIATDKSDYIPGEYVKVTGRVEGRLNEQTVRVSLDGSGQHTYSDVKIERDGSFCAYVLVDRSAAGKMTVKALALGQTEAAKTVDVSVYNIRLTADETRWLCNETYIKEGQIRIYNPSDKVITGIKLEHTLLPYGCNLTWGAIPSSIAANSYADITYSVNPSIAMNTATYEHFTLTASCDEGVTASLQFSYQCRAISANLYANDNPVNTTLLINSSRIIEVKITNYGLQETGDIKMIAPQDIHWISSLAPSTLPSLQPGQSAILRFQLNHEKGMHSGQKYSAHFNLNAENGPALGLNFNITIVGTEYSKLNVKANDVYSLANQDFSHVGGATIEVINKKDGKTVLTGNIDANGQWTTSSLTQGSYDVTIKAPRHKTVKKSINVGPGEDINISLTLPYQAVELYYVSSEDIETNTITLESRMDIDKSAPQAIVIAEFPEKCFRQEGEYNVDIVLTNVGLRPAINPTLSFPTNFENIKFTVNNSYPSILNPGESYVLNVTCNIAEHGKRAIITSHEMKYGFTISGNNLSETDIYQQITGDGDKVIVAPDPEDESGDDDDESGDEPKDERDDKQTLILPSVGGEASIVFEDDITNIKAGQPVHAVLTISNGGELPMKNIRVFPLAEDETSEEDLSAYVDVNASEDYSGFEVTATGISLDGKKEGIMPLEFVFHEEITDGGDRIVVLDNQLSYVCGGISSSTLFPGIKLTVGYEDKIKLVYLLQKNYMADESSTENVNEKVQPAEAVMLVRNEGKNVIRNASISNEGLRIVANNDLHTVSFQGLYSAINGERNAYDFSDVKFDFIDKREVMEAHVIYKSNEMAHVDNMSSIVESTSVNVGNSIISNVEIEDAKELVRSVRAVHDRPLDITDLNEADVEYTVAALSQGDHYLLNLIEDENSVPDAIMCRDNLETYDIQNVSNNASSNGAAGQYLVTVSADNNGWIYGQIPDPTHGKMVLTSVVRQSDKVTISATNFWQTDRTVTVDYSVINENLLHFADSISSNSETYELTFVPKNDEIAKALSISLYDANGKLVKDGETTKSPVVRARVDFTRPIKKLYHQSIKFTANDETLDFGDAINNVNDSYTMWDIILEDVNPVSGKHELVIDASQLKDKETKKTCEGLLSATWIEDIDVYIHIDVAVGPDEESGTVNIGSGDYKQGKMTLVAKPEPGFNFCYWIENGRRISYNPTLEYNVERPSVLHAIFAPQTYFVQILTTDHGKIQGSGAGLYDSRSKLCWVAIPDPGYVFVRWIINGLTENTKARQKNALTDNDPMMNFIVVDANVQVSAEFALKQIGPNFVTVDNDGNEVTKFVNVGDKLEIIDGQYKSISISEVVSGVDISYIRSFSSEDWQALYVPFEFDVITDLADFDVYKFSRATEDKVYVNILTSGTLEPNTPYLIKPKKAILSNELTLVNKMLAITQECSVDLNYFEVSGTYRQLGNSDIDGEWYELKDGKFQKADNSTVLKPLRFCLKKKGTTATIPYINIEIEEDSGIGSLNYSNGSNNTMYNLKGLPVGDDYKGIVIINGRKILKK